MPPRRLMWAQARRLVLLVLLAGVGLQLYFVLRIALMTVIDPVSTSFERSEAWRLLTQKGEVRWRQSWADSRALGPTMKRAVIASEDANFATHGGVEWDSLRSAWTRNRARAAVAEQQNQRAEQKAVAQALKKGQSAEKAEAAAANAPKVQAKVVGGSTITQQLAKNLFLSGERTALRKGQEFVLTFLLEGLLSKDRILTIYLNHVEWGEGVFGAQAAAQHYYRSEPDRLSPGQAARLGVMLPAPKRYEKLPNSPYLAGRAALSLSRMNVVALPPAP